MVFNLENESYLHKFFKGERAVPRSGVVGENGHCTGRSDFCFKMD
ncbi:hypothetical protein Cabys_2667 [Caldithrix abyssi DSM 13497]|uniref:Uncharacterized protein n=1 Tax=Caldithrix abyssi DSM 13497 TaxID=880073 RepID=A0A1J1C9S3_CALAY|nr:hypothetical protein Cabys_2667 [Caldithrix abyssi DSM 13497]